MNPANQQTPREEWEVRVVALLMGELPDAEAAAVRQQLAQDPALARFYQELEQTLPLVREAVTPVPGGASTPAEPLRMSSPRRETLLSHLKVVPLPQPTGSLRRPLAWLWPMTLAASLVALLGFWGSDSGWFGGTARSFVPMALLPGADDVSVASSSKAAEAPVALELSRQEVDERRGRMRAKVETVDSLALGVPLSKTPAREGWDEQDVSRRYKVRDLAAGRPGQPATEFGLAQNAPTAPVPAPTAPSGSPSVAFIPPVADQAITSLGIEKKIATKAKAAAADPAPSSLASIPETPAQPLAPSPSKMPALAGGTVRERLSEEAESLERRSGSKALSDGGSKRPTARYLAAAKSELAAPTDPAREGVVRELQETVAPVAGNRGGEVLGRGYRDSQHNPLPAVEAMPLAKGVAPATTPPPSPELLLGDEPVIGKKFRATPSKEVADAGELAKSRDKSARPTGAEYMRFGSTLTTNSAGGGFAGGSGFGGVAGGGGGRLEDRSGGRKDTAALVGDAVDGLNGNAAAAETEAKRQWSFNLKADGANSVTPMLGYAVTPGNDLYDNAAEPATTAGSLGAFRVQRQLDAEPALQELRKQQAASNGRAETFAEKAGLDQERWGQASTSMARGVVAAEQGKPAGNAGNALHFYSDFDASSVLPQVLAEDRAAARKPVEGAELSDDAGKAGRVDFLARVLKREAANGQLPVSEARQIAATDLKDLAVVAQTPAVAPPPAPASAALDLAEPRRVPPPVPQPEVNTKDNAFSTFSLNISDVSFKLAEASLQNGTLPDPGAVRTEEFLNAFEYRDPEPAAGRAVGFSYDEARYPFAHNRDVLRFSVKTAAKGREAGRPLNLVLLLDHSGSMERSDRVQIIQECLRVLTGQLKAQDKLSIVTFARTAQLRFDGMSGTAAAQAADQVGEFTPEGGTNLEGALDLAYQTARRHFLSGGVNRVVLLTDGAANLGEVEPEQLKRKVEEQRRQGIALDGFGIGWEGYADDVLEVLTRHGDGRYGFINTVEEAAQGFAAQLAGALQVAAADVKVQVEFNPARVTTYRQLGYAKHQLTKEQFRDNTVDAAEIGAAETGTALYLAEINPRGQGDLGVVRVRYKVPGTEEYREEEWTVPYRPGVPALDQAAPSLRLAATAGAFAEWLAASPFAAEVTPDALLQLLQGVPAQYGADTRPPRLERMIRQAKSISGK